MVKVQINARISERSAQCVKTYGKTNGISNAKALRMVIKAFLANEMIASLTPETDFSGKGGTQINTYVPPATLLRFERTEASLGLTRNQLMRYIYDAVAGGEIGNSISPVIKRFFVTNSEKENK